MNRRTTVSVLGLFGLLACGVAAEPSSQLAVPPQASAPAVLQAPQPADAFQSRVDRAAQLMDTDPQAAIEALDHLAVESMELRKTRPLTALERPGHAQLFVLRARAYVEAMNDEKVNESFRELLRVDPFFAQPLSPREQTVLDGLRTKESGVLEVSSAVRDCKVLIDGIEVGVTGDMPVRASLVNGPYELRLDKPGHQAAGARVTVVAGETVTVTDLAPKPQVPPVAFLADREGIEVIVDNARAGATIAIPDFRKQLSAEESAALDQAMEMARFDPATSAGFVLREPPIDRSVVVRFRGNCLIEEARTIAITADALAKLDASSALLWYGEASSVRMRPDVGTLRVSSVPTDADVYLDGALAGRSPFERSVCAGEHKVRIRHRMGSYTVGATIMRGRTEVIDVTLKPGLAFLGAVEAGQGAPRPSAELTTTIDRALASVVKSFRMATLVDVPTEVQRWNDISTAELVAAVDRADTDRIMRLLRLASDNFDAPLLLAAVANGPAAAASTQVDLLLFWYDHPGVDRVRVAKVSSEGLAAVLQRIDEPADPAQLVYQNDIGLRVADTSLPEAPLLIVSVDPGSPAALAGLKAGDAVATVDGSALTASELVERLQQRKPGDVLRIATGGSGGASRQAAVPVQRRPRRAPAFDSAYFGNAIIAKLQAASAVTTGLADRDLLGFNLALVQMRFKQWRQALDLFNGLGQVPSGIGIGPASVLFFRARCHEELGERTRALALLREAAGSDTHVLADDGATVSALAALRLAALGEAPRPPAIK